MKNRISLVFLAVALVVSLAAFGACKAEEEPPVVEEEAPPVVEEEAPPVVEEVWEWPKKLVFTTAALGGSVYTTFMAWTAVFQKDTGVMVRVVPEDNEPLRKLMIKNGEAFMCGFNMGGKTVYEGDTSYASRALGPFQVRMIWMFLGDLEGGAFSYMVRGDSSIRTIHDLKPGVKLAHMPLVPGMMKEYEAFLAWADLTLDDVVFVPFGTFTAMLNSIPQGTADVCFCPGTGHAAVFEAEAAPHGLRWIALDPEADPEGAARYRAIKPDARFGKCSKTGVPSSHGVPGPSVMSPMGTREASDEELVYHLAKWLHENYDAYKDKYIGCERGMSLEITRYYLDTTFDPFHKGTIRYLKEIGVWTEADELRQEYNVNLVTRYVKAYQEAIDKADKADIVVSPINEEWINLWENYKKELGLPVVRIMSDAEIREAMGK